MFGERRSPVGLLGLNFSRKEPPTDSSDSVSKNGNPPPIVAGGGLDRFRSRSNDLGGWVGSWV